MTNGSLVYNKKKKHMFYFAHCHHSSIYIYIYIVSVYKRYVSYMWCVQSFSKESSQNNNNHKY